MIYKKISMVLAIMLIIFSAVSCTTKASAAQDMPLQSQAEKTNIANTEGPASVASVPKSQPGNSTTSNPVQMPAISVIEVLTAGSIKSSILLIKEESLTITQLTDGLYNNASPVLNPARDKIAFYSNRDGDYDIYVMNTDGSSLQNITSNDTEDYVPQWSNDGKKICYQSDEPGYSCIYTINADGTEKFKVTQNSAENYAPVWFPEEDKILYISNEDGNFDIYSIAVDGSSKKKLTDDEYFEENLSFSPDGTKVLYAAGLLDSTAFEIFILDINTLQINRLTDNMSYSRMPVWSTGHDGPIIFNSDMDGYSEIYRIGSDGSGFKNLTNNDFEDYLLGISSDGNNIFYLSYDENEDAKLCSHNLESSVITSIIKGRPDYEILREKETDPLKIFEFIDLNILIATPSFADEVVDFALEFSENEIMPFSDKYYENGIQETIWDKHNGTTDLEILSDSKDTSLADLAHETMDRKFKLISIEGYVSPILDYMVYKKQYGGFLSQQMNGYLDIMAAESEKPSVVDAGMTISLDEYVNRIMGLYEFEEKYPGFPRIYRIVNMLNGKLWIYMGGIDNTPVFKFDGSVIPQRLEDFKMNSEKYKGTSFGNKLSEYLDLLKSENYMRTQKIIDYIENLTFY